MKKIALYITLALVALGITVASIHYARFGAPPSTNQSRVDKPERPLYYSRPIQQKDLEGRTLRELNLMRNWIYARAGNPFHKKWLKEYFAAQPWYKPLPQMDEDRIPASDRENIDAIIKYEIAIPKLDLLQEQAGLLQFGDLTPEDKIELHLLYSRLGNWKGLPLTGEEASPLEDPSLLDASLTHEQIADLSRRDLRILRNIVYARRGRAFRSGLLTAYFSATDWYKPDPAYTEARLNKSDRLNIKLIQEAEAALGGPLSDSQQKTQDGWFEGG